MHNRSKISNEQVDNLKGNIKENIKVHINIKVRLKFSPFVKVKKECSKIKGCNPYIKHI